MSGNDVWVFGYASLMWRPGFDHLDIVPARLFGYHRALCVYSFLYRGTPDNPGLVAGLLPGGSCQGKAIRVAGNNWDVVRSYLHEREMIYNVYIPKWMKARVKGRMTPVYGFIANPNHEQYAGYLSEDETARLIATGNGQQGSGLEYVENTVNHLLELGIDDRGLRRIHQLATTTKLP